MADALVTVAWIVEVESRVHWIDAPLVVPWRRGFECGTARTAILFLAELFSVIFVVTKNKKSALHDTKKQHKNKTYIGII